MDIDTIFTNYLKEEESNIINYNNKLVYHYIITISCIYYNLICYLYFVWFVSHHKLNKFK
jgi:hypothetical protein